MAATQGVMSYEQMQEHLAAGRGGIIHNGSIIPSLKDLPRPVDYAGDDVGALTQVESDLRAKRAALDRELQAVQARRTEVQQRPAATPTPPQDRDALQAEVERLILQPHRSPADLQRLGELTAELLKDDVADRHPQPSTPAPAAPAATSATQQVPVAQTPAPQTPTETVPGAAETGGAQEPGGSSPAAVPNAPRGRRPAAPQQAGE